MYVFMAIMITIRLSILYCRARSKPVHWCNWREGGGYAESGFIVIEMTMSTTLMFIINHSITLFK